MSYTVASCSFGKDSLAMCILLDDEKRLDEIVFYDTGMEFDAIYAERDKWVPFFEGHGIKYTELKPERPFMYDMMLKPIRDRETGVTTYGYGWCGGVARWGTTFKNRVVDAYVETLKAKHGEIEYCIGIAADEERPRQDGKSYPLIDDYGVTEHEALEICYARGAEWRENGIRLYDVLSRVSCWCCRNKNMKELRAIHDHLPKYWGLLCGLEDRLGQMKSKPLDKIAKKKVKP